MRERDQDQDRESNGFKASLERRGLSVGFFVFMIILIVLVIGLAVAIFVLGRRGRHYDPQSGQYVQYNPHANDR